MIYGNIDGIKNYILDKLDKVYELKVPKEYIVSDQIIDIMCEMTLNVKREISIVIDRKGNIISVCLGDFNTVEMPNIMPKEKKLSGVRVIHTHPNGNSLLSSLDISALIELKLDCIAAIGVVCGKCKDITVGFCDVENDVLSSKCIGPFSQNEILKVNFMDNVRYIEDIIKKDENDISSQDRAILVGTYSEDSLNELKELAWACGINVVYSVFQNKDKIDAQFYIGSGKVEQISMLKQVYSANMIIFDDELTGSQVKNLEENIGIRVIDRTVLILEIFARRAKSKESKIQVEAAQLKYRLARLSGLGEVLSRTGGGIGTKGPGEKKLEIDRRHIKNRLFELTKELHSIKKVREVQREKRIKDDIPKVSLVGYTNAGKSTLRNKLCSIAAPKDISKKDDVFEADMLFATLDVTTRAINLPDNRTVTLMDTVGFISRLPHNLVESFKSTLEEVSYSDLLLHVVDVSAENFKLQVETVNGVLNELNASDKPIILVLNKIDKVSYDALCEIRELYKDVKTVEISAKIGTNLEKLLDEISINLPQKLKMAEYIVPYDSQSVVSYLYRNSEIKSEEYRENGTYIRAYVNDEVYNKCKNYLQK